MADMLTNYVKFLRGTTSAYNALATKNADTLYFISEVDQKVGKLYLGDILIAGNVTPDGTSVIDSLGELADVNLKNGLADKDFLGYDAETGKWIPMSIDEVFSTPVFTGPTEDADGVEGLVPAPKIGDEGKFLRADGTWATIETSSTTKVYETTVAAGADHSAAIVAVVNGAALQDGDIAIVKEAIATDKYQYTAYVYYNGVWKAMDGNYNASNVYFDEDLTYTANIGALTLGDKNSKKIESTGKSLEQVLKAILAETKDPTITNPTYSLTASVDNSGANLEIGSYITKIKWDGSYTDGGYSYGSVEAGTATEANCVATYAMSNNKNDSTSTSLDGSFTVDKIQIDSTTAKTYATVTGKCSYAASTRTPVNNIGDEVEGKIGSDEITKTANANATGFRNTWYYVGTDCTTAIDSNFVRTKATAKNSNTTSFNTVTIPAGTTRVFFAVLGDKTLKSCIDVDGMGLDVKDNFTKKTISIEGANGFAGANYSVFVTENANGMAATKFTPTIG